MKVRIQFVSNKENQVFLETFDQKARQLGWKGVDLARLDGVEDLGVFSTFLVHGDSLTYSKWTYGKDLHVCASYRKAVDSMIVAVQFLGIRDRRSIRDTGLEDFHCLYNGREILDTKSGTMRWIPRTTNI